MLHVESTLAVVAVSGLIVIGTGEAELWWGCKVPDGHLAPDTKCFGSWGFRLLLAVILEHFGFFLMYLVRLKVCSRKDITAPCAPTSTFHPVLPSGATRGYRHQA